MVRRKTVSAFVLTALLASGIGTASSGTGAETSRGFDARSDLRVMQSVTSGPDAFEAKFYSGYEDDRVTISNKSGRSIRFSSYQGFVAIVRPGDIFGVPCNGGSIAGRLAVLGGSTDIAVDEQALCGDLVLIHANGEDTR